MPAPPTDTHPERADEQAVLDHAYACLAAMRARTEAAVSVADNAAQEVDAAIARAHLEQRLRALATDVDGLAFGRLDTESAERWYVGRRHVEDQKGDPVVVDWRAEVSTPFYRATASDPFGLLRRRRFMMTGHQVDDLYDEVFDDPDSVHAARHGGVPDPLLIELERSRTGEMRDIVATIAAEQDVVIRSDIDTCLVVQGGPGTGKTAVGLHRAAFLLYEHRDRLGRDGVLVVGPNPVFLRYIAQVLPSLGETATRQTTVERLVSGPSLRLRAVDSPERARLLGDARLALVVANALRATIRVPQDDISLTSEWGRVTLTVADIELAVDEITARGVSHATGRTAFRSRMHRLAWQRHFERRGEDGAPPDEFERSLRANTALNAALAKVWPSVSGPTLAKRVLTNRPVLAAAADGVLTIDEQARIRRKGARKIDDEPWTLAELVVVDEAEARVNGVARTYGHLMVDEAQDLSAMELRALARRCPTRSMTVLGDLAQATAPAAQSSWEVALQHLGEPATAQIEELGMGYRVPAPVMDLANRLLPWIAPDLTPPGSVRENGRQPRRVGTTDADLAATVAVLAAELAAEWLSVGVIVPDAPFAAVAAALGAAGIAFDSGLATGVGAIVTLLAPAQAKGLEFDAVVVVEPAAFGASDLGADDVSGGRMLYIALTRAVQELVILHARPLPRQLNSVHSCE